MNCSKCGYESNNDRYCVNCGKDLYNNQTYSTINEQPVVKNSKIGKTIAIISLIFLLIPIIIAGLSVYWYFASSCNLKNECSGLGMGIAFIFGPIILFDIPVLFILTISSMILYLKEKKTMIMGFFRKLLFIINCITLVPIVFFLLCLLISMFHLY